MTICNDEGQEIARKLIGVGALNPGEQRTFTLSVSAKTKVAEKGGAQH